MGTVEPSGRVTLVGPAVRLTVCWPKATTPPKRRRPPTRIAAFKVALKSLVRIGSLSLSVGLVNHKFPGINQHHHQHSAREDVIGSNLALVMRMPHKREAALVARVGLRVGGLQIRVGPGCTGGRIRTEIGTT